MGRSRIKKALLVIAIVIVIVFVLSLIFRLAERPLGEKIGVIEIEGIIGLFTAGDEQAAVGVLDIDARFSAAERGRDVPQLRAV